ncbi:MAG TPA: cysteate synthase [Terriglobales bacterium]|jgi:cysteate synthase|nr:cysteate synthase [Terriglobales bacterium]
MHYRLRCKVCGSLFDDDGFMLACPVAHAPSLLISDYSCRTLECDEQAEGMYRYRCWLPVLQMLGGAGRPITYQSKRLGSALQLPNLWITFSGFWPERGATLETATFKELEAYAVLSRVPKDPSRALVIASAGNTAAAFARTCSENTIPCVIVIPARGMQKMRFRKPLNSCVKIICLVGSADYSDAIAFAEQLSGADNFYAEGGVKNIGRRDGIGTAMLHAVETIGQLPDYYFQAIGSGAGAIAAWEAATRLVEDGRFGCTVPSLMLSQNLPFTPIYDSWKRGGRELIAMDPDIGRMLTQQIVAPVLSNQRPPYAIRGGTFDALSDTKGDMLAVDNREAMQAMQLFEEYEGIDIDPAAGVALASLMKAVRSHQVRREAVVLLHITGGGWCKRASENRLIPASADLEFTSDELFTGGALASVRNLFRMGKRRPTSEASEASEAA